MRPYYEFYICFIGGSSRPPGKCGTGSGKYGTGGTKSQCREKDDLSEELHGENKE